MIHTFKKKKLRVQLDKFAKYLNEDWITPLNPDNIKIEFGSRLDSILCIFKKRKIVLNPKYDSDELFAQMVYELYILKHKQHLFHFIFNYFELKQLAEEWKWLAQDWYQTVK